MNYSKVYNLLIAAARNCSRTKNNTDYYELHHIIPRSKGGPDTPSNLVLLTAREHYIAHHLLYRSYPRDAKIALAFFMLVSIRGSRVSARQYETLKHAAWPAMAASSRANGYKSRDQKTGFHALSPEQRSANSRKIGLKTAQDGTGIFAATPEERSARSKKAGAASGRLAVEQGTGIHAMSPEQLLESRKRGGKTAATNMPLETRLEASAAGSKVLREKAVAQYQTTLAELGVGPRPTRQDALKLGLNKYYGSTCKKHTELQGLRYTRTGNPCTECVRERTQARRSTKKRILFQS